MKFTVNTNTLINAVSLGIVSSNTNRFDRKSTLVQISVDNNYLIITLESNMIYSQISLVGVANYFDNEDRTNIKKYTKLVDALMFKQLTLSFDTEETEFVFIENGIELHSGKSKFVLPQLVDSEDMMFTPPTLPDVDDTEMDFNKDNWDYIKNNQLYALAKAFTIPIYTYVYVDDKGNVIAGDMDNVLFTLSHKLNLNTTCLLSDKIINLFNVVPSGTKLVKHDDKFIMTLEGEGFNYVTEFTPRYEEEEDIGDYNADMFLSMMQIPDKYCSFEPAPVNKFLSQISFMSNSNDDIVKFSITDNEMVLLNNTDNQSTIKIGGNCPDFEISFFIHTIKDVIGNYTSEEINLSPLTNSNGELAGILVWDNDLVTMVAGVEG